MASRRANSLTAHCWNEEQGCEFVGTVKAVLQHYEEECTFHAVECPRCAVSVLHKHLPAHYVAGCITSTLPAGTGQPSLPDTPRTSWDWSDTLGELKAALRETCNDQLASIQSQMSELTRHLESQGAQFLDVARSLKKSEAYTKSVMAGKMETDHDGSSELAPHSRSDRSSEASTNQDGGLSSEGGVSRTATMTSPWRSEKMLVLRKLECIADVSLSALEHLRQKVQAHLSRRPVIARCERVSSYSGGLPVVDSTLWAPPWQTDCSAVQYLVTVTNGGEIMNAPRGLYWTVAEVMAWHRRDSYVTVAVGTCNNSFEPFAYLEVRLKCFGLLKETSFPLSPDCCVTLLHKVPTKNCVLPRMPDICVDGGLNRFACLFRTELRVLNDRGFLQDGELKLGVVLVEEQG
ncbi:hypothetical protein V5799_005808 [Amblyomma americanum]|uniref:Tnf receptor-associated factor n=1 Tax=Amblyomma americanum TaxID=6943 RepID=A0AAQ4DY68_AMBAM